MKGKVMLNSTEITSLIARLTVKHAAGAVEVEREHAESSNVSVDDIIEGNKRRVAEFKLSGKCVAADHFTVDQIDAMAKCFDIDFQTFRHLDIGDALILQDEWFLEYATTEDAAELYPLDFLTECELEARKRHDDELKAKIGIAEFFKLKKEECEERRKRRMATRQLIQPPSVPIHLSSGRH